jgi:acyl-coenzyme A thioesterase PaaI-like protein
MPEPTEFASFTSASRLEAAARLRELGHALISHQCDDALLDSIAEFARSTTQEVERAPERPHAFRSLTASQLDRLPSLGPTDPSRSVFPDSIISGKANPMGLAANIWREDEESLLSVTLGAGFEGAPGRAHGGVVAALIDEAMGLVLSIHSTLAFTGRLTVHYRAPTPVGEPLWGRSRLASRNGRKLTVTAEIGTGDTVLAEAEGLFIAVDPTVFFDRTDDEA